jgi:hypothetical protein
MAKRRYRPPEGVSGTRAAEDVLNLHDLHPAVSAPGVPEKGPDAPDPRTPGLDYALAWSGSQLHVMPIRILREEVLRLSGRLEGIAGQ